MDDSAPSAPASRPPTVPIWIWALQWGAAGALGGWLGSDAFSFRGWALVALMMVGTLSLSEGLRWWRLGRRGGDFHLRSLLAMVVSFGVLGGLLLSLLAWLVTLVVGSLVARLPGVGGEAWLRWVAGAGIGAALFALSRVAAQRQQSSSDQQRSGTRAEQGTTPDRGGA